MALRDVSMFMILGEDAFHRTFVRQWLAANDVPPRRVHVVEPPADKSGGWKFVVERAADEARAARARNFRAQTRLIVVIDADDESLERRHGIVADAIAEADLQGAGDVCVLVPKRHIETWVHALDPADPAVDESTDYKTKSSDQVKAAARRLARMTAAPASPPSLVDGYTQFANLKR